MFFLDNDESSMSDSVISFHLMNYSMADYHNLFIMIWEVDVVVAVSRSFPWAGS
jgi:hypothetical protein